MSTLEICQRIQAIDRERAELENKLFLATGKNYDEFMDGMRRLLAPIDVDDRIGMTPPKV
jgi:hypothetical protein